MQNVWSLKFNGKEILNSMLGDLKSAQVSIELEQFSFHDDKIGHQFLRVFEAKIQQGVRIRLICDAFNSQPLFLSQYYKKLERMGVELIKFNPVSFLHPARAFYRIHKKVLIIDSKIAWVGGIGIKDKFLNFRDTQVRLVGPAVDQVSRVFEALWANPISIDNRTETGAKDTEFQYLVNYNGFQKKEIYEWLRDRVANAKKKIYFTTSYFYPDRNFFQLLLDKAREGVDVKIILRGKDDEFFPFRASASYFEQALNNGISLYRYGPNILHAKTLIIDDEVSIGSCNLDKFSFYYNLEANISSRDAQFVHAINEQFAQDLRFSTRVKLKHWKKRPLYEYFVEMLIWPIHNYL